VTSGKGIQLEQLVPSSRGHLLQGSIHVIAPGGCTRGKIAHEGEEVGYVLSGELELTLGEEVFQSRGGRFLHLSLGAAPRLPQLRRDGSAGVVGEYATVVLGFRGALRRPQTAGSLAVFKLFSC
jgi:hypothetical protein